MPENLGRTVTAFTETKTTPAKLYEIVKLEKDTRTARRLSKTQIVLYFLAALALSVALARYGNLHRISTAQYTTARIDRGDIEPTVATSGNLNAVVTVQVGSQVSGNIIALYADFNTRVKKGQVVALIDPAPFKAVVEQSTASLNAAKAGAVSARATVAKSQSDLASAQANQASQEANLVKAKSAVDLARLEYTRASTLLSERIESQEFADTARANYDQAVAGLRAAEAQVKAAEASVTSAEKQVDVATTQLDGAMALVQQATATLSQAQLNLGHTQIRAPVDGTVQSRNMDVGQTVAASFQAPTIFLVAQDLTKMQVDTNVDEADVGSIRVGQQASFTVDAYPGQIFKGSVAQIRKAPINVQNVVTYDVVVAVSNPDLKLFPGMTANVILVTGRASNVLRIPKAALRFRPAVPVTRAADASAVRRNVNERATPAQTVYLLDKSQQPTPVMITPGVSDANFVELKSGDLAEGANVIISGARPSAQSLRISRRSAF